MELKKEVAITIEDIFTRIIKDNNISDNFNKNDIKSISIDAVDVLFSNYDQFRKCLLGKMEFEEFKKMSENNENNWSEFYKNKFSIKIKDLNTKENLRVVFMYIIKEFEQKFFDWVLNMARNNKKE